MPLLERPPWSAGPPWSKPDVGDAEAKELARRKRLARNARRRRRRKGAGQRVYHCTAFSELLIDHLVRVGLLPDNVEHSDEQIEYALTLWVDGVIRK